MVFSSIDLWKGCISGVGDEFNNALVVKEYPIYVLIADEVLPDFLAVLFRSRYYRRVFRGHHYEPQQPEKDSNGRFRSYSSVVSGRYRGTA